MKKWSSQWTQFMQLRNEAWKKFRTSTGFEPVTSRLLVRCSTNWAMKPLTLGAGQLWVHMFPWKKWVLMIYEINHIWTAEMKWKWRNDRRSERNLCNCVKKPEKNSGLQSKMKSLSTDKENGSLSGVHKTSATASKPPLSFAAFWPRKEDDHSKYFKPSVAKRLKNMGIHSLPHIEFFWGFQYFCWHGWVQAALQNSGEIFTFGRPEQWRSSSPPLQSSISGNAFRTEVCRCLDTWNKIQHEAVF